MPQDYTVLEAEPESQQADAAPDYQVLEPEPAQAPGPDYTVLIPEPTDRQAKGALLRAQLAAARPAYPIGAEQLGRVAELGEWALTGVRDFPGKVVSGILNAPVALERKVGLL